MQNSNPWYLGTIGFSYRDWVGPFYPTGMAQHEYLPFYSKVFNSVELDTTFHALPRRSSVQTWATTTPSGFKFSLKTPRRITHELALREANSLMDEFLEAILPLGEKIGPVLIQLPPSFTQDNYATLSGFLKSLPPEFQYAVEFRHKSWYNEKTVDLLSENKVCWTTIDYPKLPREIYITTRFIYIRWIGINNLYHYHTHERVDKTEQLKTWIEIMDSAAESVDEIFGYFNNDYAGFAAGTCERFKRIAGIKSGDWEIPHQDKFL